MLLDQEELPLGLSPRLNRKKKQEAKMRISTKLNSTERRLKQNLLKSVTTFLVYLMIISLKTPQQMNPKYSTTR